MAPPAARIWAAWAACIKRRRKPLKLLDFLDAQKRIYAKLTPLTPKIQAHDPVTEIGTCLKMNCTPFVRQYGILLGNGVFCYAKRSTKQTIYTGIQKTGD